MIMGHSNTDLRDILLLKNMEIMVLISYRYKYYTRSEPGVLITASILKREYMIAAPEGAPRERRACFSNILVNIVLILLIKAAA